ncbi:MAG TPA: adenosylcobinamide-GDP ribazoletransferase [Candidatus Mucispirillum faecigallinarum]|uniref:Adenosylcobinamide-GDP ribazoletransferase n=1 Tax=Candidatus Mucispirillum faecigallinarum TaxID=2838699 RepID=A0A9D2GUW4_9BACT|nr:adenosylcobinamide-GDP ribazoletransferase [Candidatus Mucispirillum faecigallinarum]
MGVIKSFLICLSMYTTIPVPQISWDNKNMKYIFFMLPLIGIMLGLIEYLIYIFAVYFNISSILYAALSTAALILFTGGIHLDGYADTMDAVFCHGDIEKRRQVLSDAHTGAFAVIYTILYIILLFAGFENMFNKNLPVFIFILIFMISRLFVLYLIAFIPSSQNKGLLYIFSSKENKKLLLIYTFAVTFVLFFLTYILINYKFVIILLLILVIISIILIKYFKKVFGGISGDLAGFSICIYEISALLLFSIFRQILWN